MNKKIKYKELLDYAWLNQKYTIEGLSDKTISKLLDCSQAIVAIRRKALGIVGRETNGSFTGGKPWNKGKTFEQLYLECPQYIEGIRRTRKYGNDHFNYKGGFIQGGYKFITVRGVEKALHRDIYEKHYGITLTSNQIVHHINENKLDNRIDNLQIVTRSEHAFIHKPKRKSYSNKNAKSI